MTKIGDIEAEYYMNEDGGNRAIVLKTDYFFNQDDKYFKGVVVRAEGCRTVYLGRPGSWEYSKMTRLPNDEFPERFTRYVVEIRPPENDDEVLLCFDGTKVKVHRPSDMGKRRTIIVGEA